MNKRDYIPRSVAGFNDWQEQAMTKLKANATNWQLPEAPLEALQHTADEWDVFYPKYADRRMRSPVIVEEKNSLRGRFESQLRHFFAEYVLYNSHISDADRASLGLTSRDRTPTATALPATQPIASVDFSVRLQHRIAFADSTTPQNKAKPAGVHGCEIWIKVGGEAPVSASELKFVALDTSSPYLLTFDGSDAGKTVWYWLRWVNSRGQAGPWSVPVSAMIVG